MPAGRYTRLDVSLRKNDKLDLPANAARDLLAALCDRLKGALEESARATRDVQQSRSQELQRQMDDAKNRLQEVRSKTKSFRDAMSQLPNDYGSGDPQYALRNIRQQRNQIESELTRARARLAALEPGSGPLATEWEQVVKLREQRVAALKGEGKTSASELSEAQAKLAEARAQLAALKRADNDGQPTRSGRSSEVPQLKAQIAEIEVRLKPYAEAMAKLEDPKIAEAADQMQDMQMQEQRVRSEITEIQNRMDSFRRTAQFEPKIVVTVLDGEPDKR
jgi:chromosome segregation ATPase